MDHEPGKRLMKSEMLVSMPDFRLATLGLVQTGSLPWRGSKSPLSSEGGPAFPVEPSPTPTIRSIIASHAERLTEGDVG